jgi:hypothetical protein
MTNQVFTITPGPHYNVAKIEAIREATTTIWFQPMVSYETTGLRGRTVGKDTPQRMLNQGT